MEHASSADSACKTSLFSLLSSFSFVIEQVELRGFTTATAPGDTQSALIEQFNLSFIRPNDPVITTDPAWPPP